MNKSGTATRYTNMKGEPYTEPTTTMTRRGNKREQASPANMATSNLMSHCVRAEIGRVMCQACVPDLLSSPKERIPASPVSPMQVIVGGPNRAHWSTVSGRNTGGEGKSRKTARRSEEHTSELQSPVHLVCR